MENAGIALSILASIALVVLGARDTGPSGKRMIVIGIIVLVASIMTGWSDISDGFRDGRAGR
jgi:hypothetical protein